MKRLAMSLALFLTAAVPAEAMADIHFRGKSGQDRLVTLRTGDDGLVERFAIRWVRQCRDRRPIYGRQSGLRAPLARDLPDPRARAAR